MEGEDSKKKAESLIKKLKTYSENIEVALKLTNNDAEKVSEIKQALEDTKIHINSEIGIYEGVDKNFIQQMRPEDFQNMVLGMESCAASGDVFNTLPSHLEHVYEGHRNVLSELQASQAMCISGTTTTATYFRSYPSQSKTFKENIDKIDNKKEIQEQQKYIIDQFIKIDPSIKTDFEYFLSKLDLSNIKISQYQDVIGVRSTLFFKLIFENTTSPKRRDQIKQFVFGTNLSACDSGADIIIGKAYDLWKELSDQNSASNSAKLGNVTTTYIINLLLKIISIFYSLLKLRENNFKS